MLPTIAKIRAEAVKTGYVQRRDGLRLYFERAGVGPPLIVINNFFMQASHWRPLLESVRERADVICYDLRSQGRSDSSGEPLSVEAHVNDLEDLIAGLGLERPTLLGTCISTLFARDYALAHPDQVSGLVMVGPIFGSNGDHGRRFFHKSLLRTLDASGPEGLFDHYYPLLYAGRTLARNRVAGYLALKAAFLEGNPDSQLRAHLMSTVAVKDPPNGLGDHRCPILMLCGEDDFINDRASLRSYAAEYANLDVVFLENGGHNPYLETTDAFQARLLDFLR